MTRYNKNNCNDKSMHQLHKYMATNVKILHKNNMAGAKIQSDLEQ